MSNPGAVSHVSVVADDDGLRLDRWFKRHYPGLGFAAVARMCRKGEIRIDGKRAEPGSRIATGADIRLPPFTDAPPEQAPRIKAPDVLSDADIKAAREWVLYRDDKIIALNKPAGLPTQGGPGIDRHLDMLLDALRFDAVERPRLVHRLDKDTSGVILLGRTAGATAELAKAFRRRNAEKTYWALVVGVPKHQAGTIKLEIDKRGGPGGEKMQVVEDGKASITDYQVIEAVGNKCAWLLLRPRTGRTHQLRIHAAEALGCPIVGDGKYGGANAYLSGGVSRKLHLHARHIKIDHPAGGVFEITAPLPPHMRESWTMLGFASAAGDRALAEFEG